MSISQFALPFTCYWTFGSFQFLAVMSKTAVIFVYKQMCSFFSWINTRSEMAALYIVGVYLALEKTSKLFGTPGWLSQLSVCLQFRS